jgi:DNA-binding transcriptional ArsR family regulator
LPYLTPLFASVIFNHMVEYNTYLDGLFGSLADPIRRDILRRLIRAQYTISQIAENYDISFAAVAKHLSVLQKAKLIVKRRKGKEQIVSISPDALRDASHYLTQFEALWNYRFDALDNILKEEEHE